MKQIIIAGPCSAESEQQVISIAKDLQGQHIDYFRAGLWKPRTSPHSFAGVGQRGIAWLCRIEQELHLLTMTEIATTEHLRACVDAGLRNFWIGARTTTNPFMVQQIADEISNTEHQSDLHIFVKNPMHADLALWCGAIERLQAAGVGRISAIHRGFAHSQSIATTTNSLRNQPQWDVAISLKQLKPEIDIICDASHIAGKRQLVAAVAQQAVNLQFDGLMIEVHPTPASALSDSEQQLTLSQFESMMSNLSVPQSTVADAELLALREQIDEIDDEIWMLIHKRLQVVQQIGSHKRKRSMPVLQNDRYQQILQKRIEWAKTNGLSSEIAQNITNALHTEALQQQLSEQ